MRKVDQILIWLYTHSVYLFVTFCIFMGAMYQFINNKNEANLGLANRLFSVLLSVLFVGIIAAYGIDNLKWNTYLISILGILGGMGADRVLRWVLQLYSDSEGFEDFFGRMARAIKAGFKVYNAVKNEGNDDDDE